jgi:hypothetical protein
MLITFPAFPGIDYSLRSNPVHQIAMDTFQREGRLGSILAVLQGVDTAETEIVGR